MKKEKWYEVYIILAIMIFIAIVLYGIFVKPIENL